MIYTLKIKLPNPSDQNDWEYITEVDGGCNLEDLHLIIQGAVEFDNDHMYEFYIANTAHSRERKHFECDDQIICNTTIESFIQTSRGKKMFYLFDYGDSWVFQVSKTRKKPFEAIANISYPNVISQSDFKPEQYPDWDDEDDFEDD